MTGEDHRFSGQGAVLLDIGGDVGALIVQVPAAMVGVELGIDPIPYRADWVPGHHVAVIARRAGRGVQHTAVFPTLPAGDYALYCRPDGAVRLRVSVHGGQVTEEHWPDS